MTEGKYAKESECSRVEIVLQSHINGIGRLFGGQLLSWIDVVGAVAARRHSGSEVVTASIDHLDFINSAMPNDTVQLDAKVTYTGRTSVEVRVRAYAQTIGQPRRHICTSYATYVAINPDGSRAAVPRLIPESEEEIEEFRAGERRRALRLERKTSYGSAPGV